MDSPENVSLQEGILGLEHEVLEMGGMADAMCAKAIQALADMDVNLARHVLTLDDAVDMKDLQIEEHCMRVLALQQPMAIDLRLVGAIMKFITDIERVGDLAIELAKICLKVESEFGATNVVDLKRMGTEARNMFLTSLDAFVKRDQDLVIKVIDGDDVVDGLYRDLRVQLFEDMRKHPENVVVDGWLLLAVHHVERIADHAVNIAERVHFVITGKVENLSRIRREEHLG